MSSVVLSGDTSGAITVAAPAVAGTNTITLPAATGTVALTSGSAIAATTLSIGGTALGAGNASIMKNRIINGAMVIDQRNAGASVTPTANPTYVLDRWRVSVSQASKISVQQNAGSVTLPAGFTNYLGITSLAATSTSSDYYYLGQSIEGFNLADLGWGTANAKTVTLSFLVYSSLTGTFGGSLYNNGGARSYPFTYSIPVANTWTTISVTIAGDTSGTWLTTNGVGVSVNFGLGVSSTFSGTAGSWSGSTYFSATGATSVVGTSGATFYITGVQLEVGSSATGYEYRQYQQELALCQRYYQTFGRGIYGTWGTTSAVLIPVLLQPEMRSSPTATILKTNMNISNGTSGFIASPASVGAIDTNNGKGAQIQIDGFTGSTQFRPAWSNDSNVNLFSLSSEL